MKNELVRTLLFLLALTCGLVAVSAKAHKAATVKAEEKRTREMKLSLSSFFPGASRFILHRASSIPDSQYWTAILKDSTVAGYAFTGAAQGYIDTIECLVGITTGGVITGVKIVRENETPGIGTHIEDSRIRQFFGRTGLTTQPSVFLPQFSGKNVFAGLHIGEKNDYDDAAITAVSGATISSQAVLNAINGKAHIIHQLLSAGKK